MSKTYKAFINQKSGQLVAALKAPNEEFEITRFRGGLRVNSDEMQEQLDAGRFIDLDVLRDRDSEAYTNKLEPESMELLRMYIDTEQGDTKDLIALQAFEKLIAREGEIEQIHGGLSDLAMEYDELIAVFGNPQLGNPHRKPWKQGEAAVYAELIHMMQKSFSRMNLLKVLDTQPTFNAAMVRQAAIGVEATFKRKAAKKGGAA